MNIYLLSGLGADKRVFSNLSFSNKYVVNHIDRILPLAFIKPDFIVKEGGHLMVDNQYEMMTSILAELIDDC